MTTSSPIGLLKAKCPHCGYGWITRTARPKACPHCKRYLIAPKGKRKVDEKVEPPKSEATVNQ